MSIYEKLKNVNSKEEFINFLKELEIDYKNNQQEWENRNIDEYLNSIWGWAEDISPTDNRIDWEHPTWSTIALLFYMGKIYE